MAQFDAKKWAEFSGQGQKKEKQKKEQPKVIINLNLQRVNIEPY